MTDVYEITSLTQFLDSLRLTEGILFRGEKKKYPRPCEPMGFRDGEYSGGVHLMDPIMRRVDIWMREVALSEGRPLVSTTDLEHMILAQHYGVATRLLDWTLNPLVACWFAASSEPTEDGYLYEYEMEDKNISIIDDGTIDDYFVDDDGSPAALSDRAIALQINPFNANNNRGQNTHWQELHFFRPPYLPDSRILSQSGVISIHPKPESFELARLSKIYKIAAKDKFTVTREIAVLGINRRTLGLATRDSLGKEANENVSRGGIVSNIF